MRVLLIVVLALFSTACASTRSTPRPLPSPGAGAGSDHGLTPVAVVETALALRGTPYRNGGSDLRGFDCSGFVWYVFSQNGLAVPRTVAEQYESGRRVKGRDLQPGDLVFFQTSERGASHVGIALDQTRFVHAPSSSGVVRVETLEAKYWASRYLGARRVQ